MWLRKSESFPTVITSAIDCINIVSLFKYRTTHWNIIFYHYFVSKNYLVNMGANFTAGIMRITVVVENNWSIVKPSILNSPLWW